MRELGLKTILRTTKIFIHVGKILGQQSKGPGRQESIKTEGTTESVGESTGIGSTK